MSPAGKAILVVDDGATNRKLMRVQLEAAGYAVVEAVDGRDALDVLHRNSVDAVISDVLMPRMDGYGLCREIRSLPSYSTLPVIFYSATYTTSGDEQLAIEVGADKFIRKPQEFRVILQALEEVLTNPRFRIPRLVTVPEERADMMEFSERLVTKLEEKNIELAGRTDELRLEIDRRRQTEDALRELNENLEQKVEQRTAELERANKELEAFSYSVSHDLRPPLRAIDGFAQALIADFGPALAPEAHDLLNRVVHGVLQMNQLIDALLGFSKAGWQNVGRTSVDMNLLVRDVWNELARERSDRSFAFSVGTLPASEVDRTLMHQVFQNLLSNAIKFTGTRDVATVSVTYGVSPRNVDAFCVRDNGVGFDMAIAGDLFHVFKRLHPQHEFEGTGVGLALVRRIVERHGGIIWAESFPDKGTTIYFTIGHSSDSLPASRP